MKKILQSVLMALLFVSGVSNTRAAYDPTIGRWLTRDPLPNAERHEGPSLYEYVGNRSFIFNDPLGLGFTTLDTGEGAEISVEIAQMEGTVARRPASEKCAVDMAKKIEKDLGGKARDLFHDLKEGGDRTLQELKEHVREVYDQFNKSGKSPPPWMR